EDIMEFGNVQRGVMGVEGAELNSAVSRELKIDRTEGFFVNKVRKNSGAEAAGIRTGDIITRIDDRKIASFADLSGYINTKRPDDVVRVTYEREGKNYITSVKLNRNEILGLEFKGLELTNIDNDDKKRFKIDHGLKIAEVKN